MSTESTISKQSLPRLPIPSQTALSPLAAGINTLQHERDVMKSGKAGHGYRGALVSCAIILCQFVQMIPFGAGITGAPNIAEKLQLAPENAVWITGSYPLTQGTFVLIGGRLGAIYGHKNAIIVAGGIWVIFQLITGFMRSIVTISIMRALSGTGGAFIVPNAIALLTITFPPGSMRNISIGLFGAMAPIGAAGGSVFPGFFGQLTPWWWLFYFLAVLGTLIFTFFYFVVPSETEPMDPSGKMDVVGAYLGVTGLILFNFVWTQASIMGWIEPYIYALLLVSILHLSLFILWEYRFATEPVLPLTIWTSPSFTMMMISAFLTFMSVGIVLWYSVIWNIHIRHYSIFLAAAASAPLAVMGAVAAILSAAAVRYIAAEYLLAFGSLTTCISLILIATMPEQQTYWAQVFPSLLILGFGPDFIFTAAQIIASVTVKRSQQGIAGSLVGTLMSYGLATGLGFAGTVEYYTNNGGQDRVKGYRNALYLGIGMAGLATVIALIFVRIPKNRREGWDEDECNGLNQEAARSAHSP